MSNTIDKIKGNILLKGGKIYDPFLSINKVSDILIKKDTIIKISKDIPVKDDYKVIDCKKEIITAFLFFNLFITEFSLFLIGSGQAKPFAANSFWRPIKKGSSSGSTLFSNNVNM